MHESVQVDGRIGHLKIEPAALHLRFAFRAPEDHGPLHYAGGRAAGVAQDDIGLRHLIADPVWTFLQGPTCCSAVLDGLEGLTIAYMAMMYNFVKYAKARFMMPRR